MSRFVIPLLVCVSVGCVQILGGDDPKFSDPTGDDDDTKEPDGTDGHGSSSTSSSSGTTGEAGTSGGPPFCATRLNTKCWDFDEGSDPLHDDWTEPPVGVGSLSTGDSFSPPHGFLSRIEASPHLESYLHTKFLLGNDAFNTARLEFKVHATDCARKRSIAKLTILYGNFSARDYNVHLSSSDYGATQCNDNGGPCGTFDEPTPLGTTSEPWVTVSIELARVATTMTATMTVGSFPAHELPSFQTDPQTVTVDLTLGQQAHDGELSCEIVYDDVLFTVN